MHSSVDIIAKSDHFIVRICEDGTHTDMPFKIRQFADSYACGQRIRLAVQDAAMKLRPNSQDRN